MPHRLINWWSPKNANNRAAVAVVLKVIGAELLSGDAEVEGLCGRSAGDCNHPPAGDDTQQDDKFPRGRKRPFTAAVDKVASLYPGARPTT